MACRPWIHGRRCAATFNLCTVGDEYDAAVVVRRGNSFNQLFCVSEPLRKAGLLDVSLRATHAVIIGHDLRGNQVSAPLNTAAEAMAWRLTKVPRNDSQDNLTQADFHTGHDEAIFVLAAPGPQARTHRVDLRKRERRQEHLHANQPVSLGVARSERRIATPSSRRASMACAGHHDSAAGGGEAP